MPTPHIEAQKEDIAKIVIMPGDPLRAKKIADEYLQNPKQVNSVITNQTETSGKQSYIKNEYQINNKP